MIQFKVGDIIEQIPDEQGRVELFYHELVILNIDPEYGYACKKPFGNRGIWLSFEKANAKYKLQPVVTTVSWSIFRWIMQKIGKFL